MHQPVLLKEVLEFLAPHAGGVYMDGSLGAGGYAQAILEAANPDGILLGFDIDEGSIHKVKNTRSLFSRKPEEYKPYQIQYSGL